MTTCSRVRLLILWGYIKGRCPLVKKTLKRRTTGTMWRTCTCISFRLCYEARPFENSWLGKLPVSITGSLPALTETKKI